jgi:hypothetical protein
MDDMLLLVRDDEMKCGPFFDCGSDTAAGHMPAPGAMSAPAMDDGESMDILNSVFSRCGAMQGDNEVLVGALQISALFSLHFHSLLM